MRYLRCMVMLNYALDVLKKDSRAAVPVSKMDELLSTLKSLRALMVEDQMTDSIVMAKMNDITSAVITVKQNSVGMQNLTDVMKQELIGGVDGIKSSLSSLIVRYYRENEFEATAEVIPIMRDVVDCYLASGGQI